MPPRTFPKCCILCQLWPRRNILERHVAQRYSSDTVQGLGSTNRQAPGLVNFFPALAYHFCLNLPAAFTQPGVRLIVEPCRCKPLVLKYPYAFGSPNVSSVMMRGVREVMQRGRRKGGREGVRPSSKLATFSLSDANHDVRSNRRIDNNNNRNCDAKLRMPKRITLVGCHAFFQPYLG